MNRNQPLVVICGPTASGKTGLAVEIANLFDGEIISADSRAIYEGLDIGTAKPSLGERQGIVHYGIDLVKPGERFSAGQFKQYAVEKIADIRRKGKTPILVGGTGLYIDSVIFDYVFPSVDISQRQKFEKMTLDELQEYCSKNNIILPSNYKNKRYVINTILRHGTPGRKRDELIENCIVVGIATDKQVLRERIVERANTIVSDVSFKEAMKAAETAGWQDEALTANIYRLAREVDAGDMTMMEARAKFVTLDWQLAKRQLTWLRRNEYISWLPLADAHTYLVRTLAKLNKS